MTTRTRLAAFIGFATLWTIAGTADHARAAFSGAELACREKIAKDGSKLADKTSQALAACHRLRSAGKIDSSTNCNDITAADTKGKAGKAATKLVNDINAKCSSLTPSNLLYTGCPSPCDSEVPAINNFQDVAACMVCVIQGHAEAASVNGQGNPSVPLNKDDGRCHSAIGKGQTKFIKTIVKERSKCQKAAERTGTMDTSSCIGADPAGKIQKAETKGRATLSKQCANAAVIDLDACSFFSLDNLKQCVFDEARVRGRLTFKSFYELAAGGSVTTTTFSSTTTSTMSATTTTMGGGPQDPQCPNLGELTLIAGIGRTCTTNADCVAATCDTGLGRCLSPTDLDTGWTGISHDADINDGVITLGNLSCAGPAPVCGLCNITGINPSNRTCRCANDNQLICHQPFQVDAGECGAGNVCNCYFGGPLPLSAGNTPACVVNRFAQNVTGTANVDTGSGSVTAHLKSLVFLGEFIYTPCPACGGTCTAGTIGVTCALNPHCDTSVGAGDGVCGNLDPTPNDGVRGGKCYLGRNDGQSCDVDSPNASFPAPGGAGQSLDCFPNAGLNVSGAGLTINLTQTTGSQSISAAIPCGLPPFAARTCPCGQCSNDTSIPCTSNADCSGGGNCNATGGAAFPNQCDGEGCTDLGGGINGECTTGPDDKSCDAVLRANGEGFISCNNNGDCAAGNIGIIGGQCTLSKRRKCFLDPIKTSGQPSPTAPLGAAVFCIPKTANSGINSVAGLPGPGRVVNQGSSRTFCASNQAIQYQPGIGGCP